MVPNDNTAPIHGYAFNGKACKTPDPSAHFPSQTKTRVKFPKGDHAWDTFWITSGDLFEVVFQQRCGKILENCALPFYFALGYDE